MADTKNPTMKGFEELAELIRQLNGLLSKPEWGLLTWNSMLLERLKKLRKMLNEHMP